MPILALAVVSPVLYLTASMIAESHGARGWRQFLADNAAVLALIGLPPMGPIRAADATRAKRAPPSSVTADVLGSVLLAYEVQQRLNRQKPKAPITDEEEHNRAAHQPRCWRGVCCRWRRACRCWYPSRSASARRHTSTL